MNIIKDCLKLVFCVIVVGIGAYGITLYNNPKQEQPSAGPPMTRDDQRRFETARRQLFIKYRDQPNEIKASAVFNEAKELDLTILTRKALADWRGKIDSLKTVKGGDSVSFTILARYDIPEKSRTLLAPDFQVRYSGRLERGTPAYDQLANLEPRMVVTFSGVLTSKKEESLTEFGSISTPEFRLDLQSISKASTR